MTATVEASPRDTLLAALGAASGPMDRADLAEATGIGTTNLGVLLHRLAKAGLVMAPARGQWQLARPEAALAVREPDTVTPARPVTTKGPQIDGAALLDGVARYCDHYVRFPSRACRDALVLWIAHSHVRGDDSMLAFGTSPRLLLTSSQAGSGKSTALMLIDKLAPRTSGLTCEPTEAVLACKLGQEHQTVCLDESDLLFGGTGKRKVNVRAILNNGYVRNGVWERMRGGRIERLPVFGPVAMAGLDALQTSAGGTLAALLSRCIVITMRRPEGADAAEVPDLASSPAADEAARQGRELLSLWALRNREAIVSCEPELPANVVLRQAQLWRPLAACAMIAGGHWPDRCRAACEELATAMPEIPAEQSEEDPASGFLAALAAMDAED